LESAKELTEHLVKKEYKKALESLDKILTFLKENQTYLVEGSLVLIAYQNKNKGGNNE
jgi:hypothetical protein